MEKFFNWLERIGNPLSIVGGFIGALLTKVVGVADNMLIVLITLLILDMISGILVEGVYFKKLSSKICYKGLIKKCMVIVLVGLAYQVDKITGQEVFRAFTITFFSVNESISILEISGKILPIPTKLKNVLYQLRKETEE